VYCHLQGRKGEQGKSGLAGKQGAKVFIVCGFVGAFQDEDKVCFAVIVLFYLSLCIQYVLLYLKDDK